MFDVELDDARVLDEAKRFDCAYRAGTSNVELVALVSGMLDLVRGHFRAEEWLMKGLRYPGLAAHRREHRRIRDEVVATLHQLRSGDAPLGADRVAQLNGLLDGHASGEDARWQAFLEARGVSLGPDLN